MFCPRLRTLTQRVAALILAGIVMLAYPGQAQADRLHLRDGRVLEGTVVREVNGYVWFRVKVGNVEQEQMFRPEEVVKVERDTPGTGPASGAAAAPAQGQASVAARGTPERRLGVPRAAIISLGEGGDRDMVGLYITAASLERCIPLLEEEKIDTVVFRINSGGGALLEIQKLSDVIHEKYKPRFRVAAWIESAISAAAMTAHCIEEIYFMPGGHYGACTGWFGQLQAVEGRELEEVLYMMEKISARGRHDPAIMRSMQIMEPLSCTIDANGDVRWYNNLEGQYIVNPKDRILTFKADEAVRYKFARGIAATHEELGRAMGYSEVEWVGKIVPGVPYPVCKAEEAMRAFREKSAQDLKMLNAYAVEYRQAIDMAQSTPLEERGKFVGRARQALDRIKLMVRNNENMALFVFNMLPEAFWEWIAEQEELLRNLMRRR